MKKITLTIITIVLLLFVAGWILYAALLPPEKGTFLFGKIRSYCENRSSSDIFGEPDDKGVVSRVGGAIDGAKFEECLGKFRISLDDLAS